MLLTGEEKAEIADFKTDKILYKGRISACKQLSGYTTWTA